MATSHRWIYRKAAAYDMPAERVDGMDVLAVYDATARAVDRARHEHRPTLLETMTYRYRGHSMADAGRKRLRTTESRIGKPVRRSNAGAAALPNSYDASSRASSAPSSLCRMLSTIPGSREAAGAALSRAAGAGDRVQPGG